MDTPRDSFDEIHDKAWDLIQEAAGLGIVMTIGMSEVNPISRKDRRWMGYDGGWTAALGLSVYMKDQLMLEPKER